MVALPAGGAADPHHPGLLLAGRRRQAIWQSVLIEDSFGGNSKFVWFDNFVHIFNDSAYWASVRITVVFSAWSRRSGPRGHPSCWR